MDFVMAWKASSIVLTGAFGILGLATEFRNKHSHKITKWGYISLTGIVVSTVLGTVAQLKQSADDTAKALALAQKSDMTLLEIKRALAPMDEPSLSMIFAVDCTSNEYADYCSKMRSHDDSPKLELALEQFAKWHLKLFLEFKCFANAKDAVGSLSDPRVAGDWSFEVDLEELEPAGTTDKNILLRAYEYKPYAFKSDGKITSIIDLPNTTCVIKDTINNPLKGLIPQRIEIEFKNGQSVGSKGPFSPMTVRKHRVYLFQFPAS